MARVTSSVTKRNRHKKILKQAKGYYGHKHIGYRTANEAVRQAKEYAFRDRKNVKREFRRLWIKRINNAARMYDITYSQLINGLTRANIEIDRKMLADIAVNDLKQFESIVKLAKAEINFPERKAKSHIMSDDMEVAAPAAKAEAAPVVEAPVVEEATPEAEAAPAEEAKTEEA